MLARATIATPVPMPALAPLLSLMCEVVPLVPESPPVAAEVLVLDRDPIPTVVGSVLAAGSAMKFGLLETLPVVVFSIRSNLDTFPRTGWMS